MPSIPSIKQRLQENNQQLQEQFVRGVDIAELLKQRSQTIDNILIDLWQAHHAPNIAIIAVGGYGREEMHPASDVDLLVLLKDEPDENTQEQLSQFVTTLWDLGLEIGHSVRTLDECIVEAKNDQTVITNLIESRFLCGENTLFAQLHDKISADKIWSSEQFFNAKMEEQENRYKRYGDTAYRVEPNLKDGPGGLRDLQTIGWIALREFGIHSIKELSHYNLLNQEEYQSLINARNFLWKVRFSLHQLAGRKEDRLLFDYQHRLAESFCDTTNDTEPHTQCIETFMQQYYRTITELERLNEMLLGLLRQRILHSNDTPPIAINDYYNNQDGYLDLSQKNLFESHPHTMLEVFHIMQIVPELKGLTPETLRELKQNLHRIDDDFRHNAHHNQIFINIMSEPQGITFALRRMNRYGVLAAYIPAFENIVGRMQYDLFHAYTVDDHTLNVIRNIRRLSTATGAEELPFCSKIFKTLPIPMILYLAGLFHDIAKGRGGSHSEKGAVDALDFCLEHDLNQHDAETVSWLVKNHLEMSSIAQRKDINDPEVIQDFADLVVVQSRLDYLYLLTICDIKGTNPTLLNNWKHSLLKGLYRATKNQLKSQHSANKNSLDLVERKKNAVAKKLLANQMADQQQINDFWARVDTRYILQHTVGSLLWQITEIIHHNNPQQPLIRIIADEHTKSSLLFIYAKDQKNLFIKITSALEQQHLNIVAARISSSHDGYVLDTLNILDSNNEQLSVENDQEKLIATLQQNLSSEDFQFDFQHHRTPRQLKHFNTPTRVDFAQDEKRAQTIITIYTADRAGLLTQLGEVFFKQNLSIHDARISTLGETAEDIFHVTLNDKEMILDEADQHRIRDAIKQKLQGKDAE